MTTESDPMSEQFTGQRASIREPFEHPKTESMAANACSVQPTKEDVATITGSQLNLKTAVSVASVAEWTDEQLSELFADY